MRRLPDLMGATLTWRASIWRPDRTRRLPRSLAISFAVLAFNLLATAYDITPVTGR
jgi:hypothetical protein